MTRQRGPVRNESPWPHAHRRREFGDWSDDMQPPYGRPRRHQPLAALSQPAASPRARSALVVCTPTPDLRRCVSATAIRSRTRCRQLHIFNDSSLRHASELQRFVLSRQSEGCDLWRRAAPAVAARLQPHELLHATNVRRELLAVAVVIVVPCSHSIIQRLSVTPPSSTYASAMNSLELDDDAFYICTEMSPRCFVVQKEVNKESKGGKCVSPTRHTATFYASPSSSQAIQIDRSQIERMVGDLEKAPPPPIDAPPAPQLPYW
ncbi:hypothetical protein NECAME_05158 [Necator americanus]|uniref:Uncharacterized protein n=1 Tax=Necator americanus TaxID=51031 RepID=W2SLF5_NECAM|nr:hypothetical protein NECAME_05158 [Necator americanus]ETN69701.1 hypothetical protein NECAME_05158 [Necator americanus]